MQINEFLDKVCNQIKYKPIRNEIVQEVESHIKESKEDYIEKGMHEKEAEEKAIVQMGNADEIGKRLNKIHKPKLNIQLLILVLILLEFGFLANYLDYTDKWKLNFIILILSVIPFVTIYFFDYRKLVKHSNLMYAIPTTMLLYSMIDEVRNVSFKYTNE